MHEMLRLALMPVLCATNCQGDCERHLFPESHTDVRNYGVVDAPIAAGPTGSLLGPQVSGRQRQPCHKRRRRSMSPSHTECCLDRSIRQICVAWPLVSERCYGQTGSLVYVRLKIASDSDFLNPGLSVNCLNSSVWSAINSRMARPSALSCSIRAFCLSLFRFALS